MNEMSGGIGPCRDCLYWYCKDGSDEFEKNMSGWCRMDLPVAIVETRYDVESLVKDAWPVTSYLDGGCGKFVSKKEVEEYAQLQAEQDEKANRYVSPLVCKSCNRDTGRALKDINNPVFGACNRCKSRPICEDCIEKGKRICINCRKAAKLKESVKEKVNFNNGLLLMDKEK